MAQAATVAAPFEAGPARLVTGQILKVASGLINPRGIAFGPDGLLYVAEAGAAGSGPPPIGSAGRDLKVGHTARVSRVDPRGGQEVLLDNLPSLKTNADEFGVADVAFLDGTLFLLTGAGGYEVGDPDYDSLVMRVDATDGTVTTTPIFNLTVYNLSNPPLSRKMDPARTDVPGGVPFGLAALYGALYATDGNQETVTRITPAGQAARVVQYPTSNRVLTGIAPGPNGALFISEFGPAPHRENSARITRWTSNGELATAEEGFTAAIDVAFDSRGTLYVLEFSQPGLRIPMSGRVVRVNLDGSHEVVVGELNYPTSIAFGPDGNLYVANSGHRADNGEGEILEVQLSGTG